MKENNKRLMVLFFSLGTEAGHLHRMSPYADAESHIANTSMTPGTVADQAAQQKMSKYASLTSTHIFCPTETAGKWNNKAVELVQELGRRITLVTENPRKKHCPLPFDRGMRFPSLTHCHLNEQRWLLFAQLV